jgi:ATP-dependent exoDNAse (exonuclease V) beta subunit
MQYSTHDNWDRMLQGGMQLLDRFAQEDRVRILQPQTNLQVKILRPLAGDKTFISYVDAIGELDGELCVIDWKTSTSCLRPSTETSRRCYAVAGAIAI